MRIVEARELELAHKPVAKDKHDRN